MKFYKTLGKIVVASLLMAMTMTTAFAEEVTSTGSGSITINREDATYHAYKVLDATTKKVNGGTVEVYSINEDFKDFFEKSKEYTFSADKGIMNKQGDVVTSDDSNLIGSLKQKENMAALTAALITYKNEKKATGTKISSIEIIGEKQTVLAQGYYLVTEQSITASESKTTSRIPSKAMLYAIAQSEDLEITPKDSEISIDKKAKNQESNVAGIGETVPFTITAGIPTYSAEYTNIKYQIKDTMSKGLTLDQASIVVEVGESVVYEHSKSVGNKVASINVTSDETGNTIMLIDFNYSELKADAENGSEVKVTYNAEINSDAVIHDANNNEAKLIYTTNDAGISDATKTYTYALNILKIDGNTGDKSTVLQGAKFELSRIVDGNTIIVASDLTTDENGMINLHGIGEGTYIVRETAAPANYSKLAGDIKFMVTADDKFQTAKFELVDAASDVVSLGGDNGNTIQLTIKNYKGINLPETGGMGTTLFVAAGAILVVAGGALLILYARKGKKA